MKNFQFEIKDRDAKNSLMRTGVIHTPHGDIKTPAFIPVGTRASVKGVLPEFMEDLGAQALLANAYHLHLRPGEDILDAAGGEFEGGLARFMNWKIDGKFAPTFTDSGGFQVMSLGQGFKKVLAMDTNVDEAEVIASKKEKLSFVDEDGVTFKSHIDGHKIRFTPEISMQIQHKLGADIMFAFDELTTLLNTRSYQEQSVDRTHRWAERCLIEHAKLTNERSAKPYNALFGVIQGANYEDLRRKATLGLVNLEANGTKFDGFGIGGALEKEKLGEIVAWCTSELNANNAEDKPRHLLGISGIDDIFAGVEAGVDTFDCVSPSREARNGGLYTPNGRFNIKRAAFATDFGPIYDDCQCYTCQNYTRAYVHHLLKVGEMLGSTLATIHNEHFIVGLVDNIRTSIENGVFYEYKSEFLAKFYQNPA